MGGTDLSCPRMTIGEPSFRSASMGRCSAWSGSKFMSNEQRNDRSEFLKQLDRTENVAASIGLVLSGVIFAAGLGAFLFVIFHVFSSKPPSWGSQGEWLYGAIACLLVAGYGFGQAASLYARKARAKTPPQPSGPSAKFHIGRDGFSFEIGQPAAPAAADSYTASWSGSAAGPMKALEITEEQIAGADLAARAGLDWDTVCRQANPAYATWRSFEQNLYRHAMQVSVERRRNPK